jgi:capsular polysaccharide biosynthesis protein
MSGQAAQIVVIDPAFVPTQPIGMSSKRMYVMGFLLALGLGLGLAMLCALLDDRVYDQVDVERLELAPVLIEVSNRSMRGRKAAA